MNGLALIALAIWAAIFPWEASKAKSRRKKTINSLKLHVVILSIIAVLLSVSLIFQFWSAYRHSAYSTDSIKYYDDKFDSMVQKRISAATALKEYYLKENWDLVTNSTDSLDYVLGFWDNLGYDEQHGKISADVVWNYFYDDIADYYQGSAEYIAKSQKEDPTWFENIKPLFDDVAKIEAQKTHRPVAELRISSTNYLEYLRSEIELNKDK